jgi:hypothetical protein
LSEVQRESDLLKRKKETKEERKKGERRERKKQKKVRKIFLARVSKKWWLGWVLVAAG